MAKAAASKLLMLWLERKLLMSKGKASENNPMKIILGMSRSLGKTAFASQFL